MPLLFAGPGVTAGARCRQPVELLDIYPTLIELCGLPSNEHLEGRSLVPQLQDARAQRPWPAITTHNQNNHGIRTENWRYIRYADGSEELYDMRKDPQEWHNLVDDSQFTEILRDHRQWLPKKNAPPAPGSRARILRYKDGVANWQEEDIDPQAPIPEI